MGNSNYTYNTHYDDDPFVEEDEGIVDTYDINNNRRKITKSKSESESICIKNRSTPNDDNDDFSVC